MKWLFCLQARRECGMDRQADRLPTTTNLLSFGNTSLFHIFQVHRPAVTHIQCFGDEPISHTSTKAVRKPAQPRHNNWVPLFAEVSE